MVIIGLLLLLGAAGLSLAAIWANQGVFAGPAGVIELFGYSFQASVGEVFAAGSIAGALVLLGLTLLMNGYGRRARHRAATRRELREQRRELNELRKQEERKQEAPASRS